MKTILITGAAGGVGSCLVEEYIARGYHVFGADLRRNEKVDSLQRKTPDAFDFTEFDASSTESAQELAIWISQKTDHLDVILNAIGILFAKSENLLEDFDIEAALPMYNVNALGPLRVVKACVGLLRKGEDKLLINISSEAGSITTHADYINRYDYCMSKCALNIQSVILQRYLKPDGIKVLAVHPGWVRTSMGGRQAPVLPADSAAGITSLGQKHMHDLEGGMYFDYDGTPRAW